MRNLFRKLFFGKHRKQVFLSIFKSKSLRFLLEQVFITLHPNEEDLYSIQKSKRSPCVIDVGACTGVFAERLLSAYPSAKLHLVEPIGDHVKVLKSKFHNSENVEVHPIGLGEVNEVVTFKKEGASTRKLDTEVHFNTGEIEHAEVKNINCFLDQIEGEIDLLQINCEGGEYLIMKALSKENSMRIRNFQIQFHDITFRNIFRILTIRQKLKRTHRKLWSVPFIWERWEKFN